MSDDAQEPVSRETSISILLAEYNTLRTELIARTGYSFQIGAAAIVGLSWVAKSLADSNTFNEPAAELAFLLLGAFIVVGFIMFVKVNNRDWSLLGKRLKGLEAQINELAGRNLLQWETGSVINDVGLLKSLNLNEEEVRTKPLLVERDTTRPLEK